jgi:hypothetical protein
MTWSGYSSTARARTVWSFRAYSICWEYSGTRVRNRSVSSPRAAAPYTCARCVCCGCAHTTVFRLDWCRHCNRHRASSSRATLCTVQGPSLKTLLKRKDGWKDGFCFDIASTLILEQTAVEVAVCLLHTHRCVLKLPLCTARTAQRTSLLAKVVATEQKPQQQQRGRICKRQVKGNMIRCFSVGFCNAAGKKSQRRHCWKQKRMRTTSQDHRKRFVSKGHGRMNAAPWLASANKN